MNGFWIFLLFILVFFHTHTIEPKETCLRLGGTAVEQPAGTFQKCLFD